MNNVLITGCNGLIGEALVQRLLKNETFNLFGIGRSLRSSINVIQLDLGKEWSDKDLPKKMDIIIHLAQSEKFREFPESSEEIFSVNTLSTIKFLEYGRKAGIKKFIYASSGGIYGNSDTGFLEEHPVTNSTDLGFYLGTKFCSEILALNYTPYFDVDILRFFFVYGKNQNAGMLIPRLVNNVIKGNEIMLSGESGIKMNPIHVSDAADAIKKAIELKGSNKFNISGSEVFTLREICETIGRKIGKQPVFKINNTEPKNLIGDNTKMRKMLIEPKIKFDTGIDEIIEKYVGTI